MEKHKHMFQGGFGLPVMAIGWSVVISLSGCWAWLESAHAWAFAADWLTKGRADPSILAPSYVGYVVAAAFALLAQWTANFCVFRIRHGASAALWIGYLICAGWAAVSLEHVHEAMSAPVWEAQVQARKDERAPDLETIKKNDAFIEASRTKVLALDAANMTRRNDAVSTPLAKLVDDAKAENKDARKRLDALPPLPDAAPLTIFTLLASALAMALAGLEFALYWGLGGPVMRSGGASEGGHLSGRGERSLTDKPGVAADPALAGGLLASGGPASPDGVPPLGQGGQGERADAVARIMAAMSVGDVRFPSGLSGRPLLDELEKAGFIDYSAICSKFSSVTRRKTVARNRQSEAQA